MGTEANAELLQALNCGICLDYISSPRGLLCGHTFCRDCLDQIKPARFEAKRIIKCPLRCNNEEEESKRPIAVKNITLCKILETTSQVILPKFLNTRILKLEPFNNCGGTGHS